MSEKKRQLWTVNRALGNLKMETLPFSDVRIISRGSAVILLETIIKEYEDDRNNSNDSRCQECDARKREIEFLRQEFKDERAELLEKIQKLTEELEKRSTEFYYAEDSYATAKATLIDVEEALSRAISHLNAETMQSVTRLREIRDQIVNK